MGIDLNWKNGNPRKNGLYFVAVKLGDAAGVYDFLAWRIRCQLYAEGIAKRF